MKPNQTERATRLECLKIAAGVAMQLKISPGDVVRHAKDYYEFVNTSNEPVEREDNSRLHDDEGLSSNGYRL